MALSLLCGGFGAASATLEVLNQSGTAGTVTIYTQDEVDKALEAKGAATEVESNKTDIDTLKKAVGDAGSGLTKVVADQKAAITANTKNIDTNQAAIKSLQDAKLDKELANSTFATRDALDDKADKTAVTALDGRVGVVEGKVAALETTVSDPSNGLVKKVTDLKTKTTQISFDPAKGTIVNGVDFMAQEVDAHGKGLTGVSTLHTTGAATIGGALTAAGLDAGTGAITGGSLSVTGEVKGNRVDAGSGEIKTTGVVNAGTLSTAGDATVGGDLNATGKVSGKGLDAGTGAIKGGSLSVTGDTTLNKTDVNGALNVTGESNLKNTTVDGTLNVNKETKLNDKLTVTGEATFKDKVTMKKDLEVKGELKTDKISMKNTDTDAAGKHDSSTAITADYITHFGEVEASGVTTKSSFTHTEKGSETYAYKGDATDWTETRSDVTADGVKTEVKDSKGNRTNTSQTANEIKGFVIDQDGNSSTASQTAKGINGNVTDKDGNKTDMNVTATENSIQIQDKDGKNTNLQVNKMDSSMTEITNADGKKTTTKQTATDITNTAEQGTIKNDAMNIENNASGNITNNAQHGTITNDAKNIVNNASENITTTAKTMDTTVTGKATESYGELDTTVNGMEKHTVNGNQDIHVTGKQTNTVESGQENIISGGQTNTITGGQINNITGNQTTIVTGGNISNKAEKITNEANTELTDKVGTNTRVIDSNSITDTVGTKTNRKIEDGKITDTAGDFTVTTEKTKGTTFAKTGSTTAFSTEAGAPTDTNIAGNLITTGRVDANELGVSDKDGDNTANLTVKAGEDGGVNASASKGTTTGSLDVKGDKVESSVKDGDKGSTISQTKDTIESTVKDGDNETSIKQTATGITNTAKDIANNAQDTITNTAGTKITDTAGDSTVTTEKDKGTTFTKRGSMAYRDGGPTDTNISGNTINTGKITMDYAEVMKDLGVHGSAKVDQNLEVGGTSTLKGDVTMESNAKVKKDLTVEGTTTTKTLNVTQNATVGGTLEVTGKATFQNDVDITGDVTARSYKVGSNTYIDANGINANDQKITNVADGNISEGSKDAVNGGQLYGVKRDLEHQVDKVGANAAAMANLRPMEFDPSSKWNIAVAIGNYGSETAAAIGAFYRPNDNVMVNLSTAFGTGENMVGGGVSVRLGKGGNKLSREETNALKAQVADLTARMDALLSVLNPNMSKDFPDVPENHWAYEAVSRLAGNDIVQGYPDGEFHGERTMTRYEMAEIIYNALSRGAEAEKELVEEFKPELQAMAASEKATAEKAEG